MQDKKYNAILDFCQNDFIHWYLSREKKKSPKVYVGCVEYGL